MILLRSLLFNAAFFAVTALLTGVALPLLALPRRAMMVLTHVWARAIVTLLRLVCGVRVELRGMERIPPGAVVIAAKHQSAFDTIVWLALLPDVAYVLKKELLSIPLYGWHARKAGMIPVDRGGGGAALRGMLRAAQAALAAGRQVVVVEERDEARAAAEAAGARVVAGNAADPAVLAEAGLATARRLFVTVPEAFEAGQVVEQARAANPALEILARAHSDAALDHLAALGATRTILGEREIAERMAEHALAAPRRMAEPALASAH